METRNTINPHGLLTLPAIIASLYNADDLRAEEITDAINNPDGARDRGFDRIDFEGLNFTDAVAHIAKDPARAALLTIDLATNFATLDYGQAVAVGLCTDGRGWYVFEEDLTRERLARLEFCEFYIFERPEFLDFNGSWLNHEHNGDSTAWRLTLTNL